MEIRKNAFAVGFIFLVVKIAVGLAFHLIADSFNIKVDREDDFSLLEEIFALIVIGPAIETVVFQFLILEFVIFLFKSNKYKYLISIIISSFAFSSIHNIDFFLTVIAFISGLIYSSCYIKIRQLNGSRFMATTLIYAVHSLYNLQEFLRYGSQ